MLLKQMRIRLFCFLLCSLLLGGCSSDQEWKEQVTLTDPITLRFFVPWGDTDPRGQILRRVTESFNLHQYNAITVSIETAADRETYNSLIKRLTAANELPDILLLGDTAYNRSILLSDRLMELPIGGGDGVSREAAPYLMPMIRTPIMLYGHADDPPPAEGLWELCMREDQITFAVTESLQSGLAVDLLFAMLQTSGEDGGGNALLKWRQIILRSRELSAFGYNRPSATELWSNGDIRFLLEEDSVQVDGAGKTKISVNASGGQPLCSEMWGIAAKWQQNPQREQACLEFLEYLRENIGEKMLSSPVDAVTLASRYIAAEEYEMLGKVLEAFLANEDRLEEAEVTIAELAVWG